MSLEREQALFVFPTWVCIVLLKNCVSIFADLHKSLNLKFVLNWNL